MILRFNGNAPAQKYIRVGVVGNNDVDELKFVIDKIQGNIDLADFEPSIKITNGNLTFADKTKHFIFDTDTSLKSVFITYKIPDKVTQQKNVDMQIIFEKSTDGGSALVWQSQIFNVTFDAALDVSKTIEKEYPDVLQDYDRRITAVESKGGITECIDRAHFPEKGEANVIYIDLSDSTQYIYDTVNDKYVIIGFNPENIKIINGNGGY